jgi:hypothetical protein
VRITSIDPDFATITNTGTPNITITDVVSVPRDQIAQGPIVVTPMPAADAVVVANPASGVSNIDIYALTGERVLTQTSHGTREQVATSHLPSGLYTVVVTDSRGVEYRAPMVIAR